MNRFVARLSNIGWLTFVRIQDSHTVVIFTSGRQLSYYLHCHVTGRSTARAILAKRMVIIGIIKDHSGENLHSAVLFENTKDI